MTCTIPPPHPPVWDPEEQTFEKFLTGLSIPELDDLIEYGGLTKKQAALARNEANKKAKFKRYTQC